MTLEYTKLKKNTAFYENEFGWVIIIRGTYEEDEEERINVEFFTPEDGYKKRYMSEIGWLNWGIPDCDMIQISIEKSYCKMIQFLFEKEKI